MGVAVRGRWPLMLRPGWVGCAADHLGVAVGGVITLPGKLSPLVRDWPPPGARQHLVERSGAGSWDLVFTLRVRV